MSDKRGNERLGIRLEVEVECDNDKSSMHTRDISNTGVFLECGPENLPPVGTILLIRIKQALGDGDAPTVRAQVVRVDSQGVALKFLDN